MRKTLSLTAVAALLASTPPLNAQEHESATEVQSAEEASAERAYHNRQQAYLSSLMTSDGWYAMEGGLRWRYVEYKGVGAKPTPADKVTVHYEGSFIDGTVFDSSFGGKPAEFPLRGLIEAWEMAIPQMHVGETIEIAAPASLAYGPRGRGPIPGGATLLFKVELLGK